MSKLIYKIFILVAVCLTLVFVSASIVKAQQCQCADWQCDFYTDQFGNTSQTCYCTNPAGGNGGWCGLGCAAGYYVCNNGCCPVGSGGGGGVRRGECNGRAVDCAPGYIRTDTVLNVECKSDYGGVGAWCGQPGTAQAVTGCCSTMIPDREYGGEICRYGDDRITTYACAPTCDANAWGAWSACSASCGGGIQTRTNACGNVQGQVCNTQSCQGPWWQVKDGDITTNGDIISRMPSTDYLDTVGSGGFPGVPVYGGSIGIAPGTISQKLWNANTTTTLSRIFNYDYFENLIPEDIVFNDINKLANGSGVTADANGYEWYKITGNLNTVGNINFGSRKVILFITGNLNIAGNINLTDGVGFFASFVSGNINVAGTAGVAEESRSH